MKKEFKICDKVSLKLRLTILDFISIVLSVFSIYVFINNNNKILSVICIVMSYFTYKLAITK